MNRKESITRQKWAKTIWEYALWTMAALLLGMGYMYLVLGPPPEPTNTWNFFLGKIYLFGLVRIGLVVGGIVAVLFIIFDAFFIKRKWALSKNKLGIRIIALLILLVLVAMLHYLLEKTINLI